MLSLWPLHGCLPRIQSKKNGNIRFKRKIFAAFGLNKKTGDYITLSGKSVISKSNYSFLYYEFINNDTKYLVKRDNFLEVWNNGKVILSKELKSCY